VTVEGPEALRIAANVVGLPELLGKAEPTKTRIAALRAQFTPVFAPSPSSRCPTSELKVGCGILGVILKMQSRAERAHGYRREAEKYAKLARSGQLDIANVHRTLAERYAWMAANLERRENLTHALIALLGRYE
jgi:hypothetical protein